MDSYNFFGSGIGGTVTPRAVPGRVRWGTTDQGQGVTNQNQNSPAVLPTTLSSSDPLKIGMVFLAILYTTGSLGYTAGAKSATKAATQSFKPKDVRNIHQG